MEKSIRSDLTDIKKCKLIFLDLIKSEMDKRRDHTRNGDPVFGEKSNSVSASLLHLSDEFEKMLKKLENGEEMGNIISGWNINYEE